MDTMKILLGATIALLLGAVAISWRDMDHGVQNAPADEIARLKKQVDELRREQDRLALEKQIQATRAAEPVVPPVSNSERDEKGTAPAQGSRAEGHAGSAGEAGTRQEGAG
jgi:hypothetical protein